MQFFLELHLFLFLLSVTPPMPLPVQPSRAGVPLLLGFDFQGECSCGERPTVEVFNGIFAGF